MSGEPKTSCELDRLEPAELLVCLYEVVVGRQLDISNEDLLTQAEKAIIDAKRAAIKNTDYEGVSYFGLTFFEPCIEIGTVELVQGTSVILNVELMGDSVDCGAFLKEHGKEKLDQAKQAINALSRQKRYSH